MLEIIDEPWDALVRITKKYRASRMDILTGYVGGGATQALADLRVRARIILGLPAADAALSAKQVAELGLLVTKHQVRWLRGLHAKLYLLDGRVAIAGSSNLTRSGFEKLDEILIATDDKAVVARASAMFAERWKKATPLNPAKLTIAPAGGSDPSSGPEGGLGVAKKGVTSGFSTKTKGGGASKGSSKKGPGAVRLIAAWPKWIPELRDESSVHWTTSPKSPIGQVHIIVITKTGDGIEDYATDSHVDAVHSIWRTTSEPEQVKGSRWPIQADFKKVVTLAKPVPKSALIAAGLIKERWPQNPSRGKLFRGAYLRRLADLLATANPKQAKKIRAALSTSK